MYKRNNMKIMIGALIGLGTIIIVSLVYAGFNDAILLPTADVSIIGLGITINYEQSGSALVKDNGEDCFHR